VIAVSSFTVVINGFQSTKLYEASRNLAIGRATMIDIVAQIAGLACVIGWALLDRSVWALVSSVFGTAIAKCILSHALLPGNSNRWQWDKAAAADIISFGRWILLSSIVGFFALNGDRLLLGSFVSPTILGIYVIAFNIFGVVDQVLSKLIVDLSYPALSEVARQRPAAFNTSYAHFQIAVTCLACLCSGILMVSGHALISLLYDPRYGDAGWMLQILAVSGLTASFRLATQSFLIFGAARVYSYIQVIRVVGLFASTPLGYYLFGLPGALWGIVSSVFLPIPCIIHYMKVYGFLEPRRELLAIPFFISGIAIGELVNLVAEHLLRH
jgi:O-antigen/teichoic acid export membrane protein